MTILVGVRCRDGIIIGADSRATFGAGGIHTIEQDMQKIDIIGNDVIVACTGSVGLAQRFVHEVHQARSSSTFLRQHKQMTASSFCKLGVNNFSSTMLSAHHPDWKPHFGIGALTAFPGHDGELCLCEFETGSFQPEFKNDRLWYCAMGSGQLIADTVLGFFREVFWKDGPPTSISDGVFAVVWTLQQVISLNPGGVGGDPNIAVLRKDNSGNAQATMLSIDEIEEHRNSVEAAIDALRNYKSNLQNTLLAPTVPRMEE
jgi:20S proteasome alpha/beta subunit